MNQHSEILTWIDGQQKALEQNLIRWSEINSGSYNRQGLDQMAQEIADAFYSLGVSVEERQLAPQQIINSAGEVEEIPLRPALFMRKRPDANRRILLTGHMDTVFPKDHSFQSVKDLGNGQLNGPGVADMKGGILVMLTALQALEQSGKADAIGYDVLISPDEEIGSPGSAALLKDCAAAADFGMTFEPALADGTLAGARKGNGYFTYVVRGLAAHAGRAFHDGRNAVTHLAKLITDTDDLNRQRDSIIVNLALIEGGTATNIVPDLAICRMNVRVESQKDQHWLEKKLGDLVALFDGADGFSVTLHGGFNRPPKIISPANQRLFDQLSLCGAALSIPIAFQATGGCCEGNNLAAAGLPNIDTLGVRGGLIHSDQEFVILDSLSERAKLSALLMLRYADGAFSMREQAD